MRYFSIIMLVTILIGPAYAFNLGIAQKEIKDNSHVGMNPGTPDDRQGGEDMASAVAVTAIPYGDTGNTVGNVDDYDAVCPYSGSTSQGIEGVGELFRITLASPLASFDPTIEARDTSNQVMKWQLLTPVVDPLPTRYALGHNYPNPFNPSTTISYNLPETQWVHLAIYSIDGRRIRSLVSDQKPAGSYDVVWNGKDDSGRSVSSGNYFCRIEAGTFTDTRKMVLMK